MDVIKICPAVIHDEFVLEADKVTKECDHIRSGTPRFDNIRVLLRKSEFTLYVVLLGLGYVMI